MNLKDDMLFLLAMILMLCTGWFLGESIGSDRLRHAYCIELRNGSGQVIESRCAWSANFHGAIGVPNTEYDVRFGPQE